MVAFASGSLSPLPTGTASGVDASHEVCARISALRGATFKVLDDYSGLSSDGASGVPEIIVALQSAANELGSAERRILATFRAPDADRARRLPESARGPRSRGATGAAVEAGWPRNADLGQRPSIY